VGKKQVRAQMRKVKPKVAATSATAPGQGASRKQRERYIQSGGMLQGYAPDFVIRLGYIAAGVAVACLIIGILLLLLLHGPYGWAVAAVAGIAWLLPIALLASFIAPGFRLALKDQKAEARLVQGQLVGASTVSTAMGLGLLMVQTRGGVEQYLVPGERLNKVPGNQVQVILTVTPKLRHVRGLQVMGQRMVPRAEPPVPDLVKRLRLLPLVTPVALAAAVIIGDDVTAFVPIPSEAVHAGLAVLVGLLLGAAAYGAFFLVQRRLTTQAQALVPGA